MGITLTSAKISNPRKTRGRAVEIEFLIDTGAIYSVVPGPIARKLALEKLEREEFTLADGTHRAYDVGEAFFELGDRRGTSKVVFGPPDVTPLLGSSDARESRPDGESGDARGAADAPVSCPDPSSRALIACCARRKSLWLATDWSPADHCTKDQS